MTYLCKIKFFELFFVKKVILKYDLNKNIRNLREINLEGLLKVTCA
jgi:hypothetical protein